MPLTRTFLAIELDEATHAFIEATRQPLQAALPGVRFVGSETWHITLAFLGEIDEAAVVAAQIAAQEAAALARPFTIRAEGIGIFGAATAPRVLWAGLGGDLAALTVLQHQVVRALDRQQLHHDRWFNPHITLARLRQPLTAPEAVALSAARSASFAEPAMPVTHISVMRSDLSPAGARYTCMLSAPLAQS